MTFRYPFLQQQFNPRTSTSAYDCCATTAGTLSDVDSKGKQVFNHVQVRLSTNEPTPDASSPGLNWTQVDAALLRLSGGRINLDVHPIGSSFSTLKAAVMAGKGAGIAVWRGVQVDAGLGFSSDFRKGHAETLIYDPDKKKPMLGDPLVDHWIPVTWALVERMCSAFVHSTGAVGTGAYYALTRDVYDAPVDTLRYSAKFTPGEFFVYSVSGGVIDAPRGKDSFPTKTSASCSSPDEYHGDGNPWPKNDSRKLVRILKGRLAGQYVEPGSTNVTLGVSK